VLQNEMSCPIADRSEFFFEVLSSVHWHLPVAVSCASPRDKARSHLPNYAAIFCDRHTAGCGFRTGANVPQIRQRVVCHRCANVACRVCIGKSPLRFIDIVCVCPTSFASTEYVGFEKTAQGVEISLNGGLYFQNGHNFSRSAYVSGNGGASFCLLYSAMRYLMQITIDIFIWLFYSQSLNHAGTSTMSDWDGKTYGSPPAIYYFNAGYSCDYWCPIQSADQCGDASSLCRYDMLNGNITFVKEDVINGTAVQLFSFNDYLGPIVMAENLFWIVKDAPVPTPFFRSQTLTPFGQYEGIINQTVRLSYHDSQHSESNICCFVVLQWIDTLHSVPVCLFASMAVSLWAHRPHPPGPCRTPRRVNKAANPTAVRMSVSEPSVNT
jgi:hypothetical protein